MAKSAIRMPAAAFVLGAGLLLGAEISPAAPSAETEVFARVGGRVISMREYQSALADGMRQKYYHGKPQEAELERFGREVGERLILQVLLSAEAARRGIEPDHAAVERQVAEYDRRYAANERWQQARDSVLPRLTAELERRSRLERLEASVRAVPAPTVAQVREYFAANPQRFTEPEQVRLSLIMLRVDPSAPDAAWKAAAEQAEEIRREVAAGADFAAIARERSADASAARGGDLGYVHRGMLPEAIERQFIDTLEPGTVSRPARLLEGIALVRLEARKPARLRSFEEVQATATELLQRERGERAWAELGAALRAASVVELSGPRAEASAAR